MGLIYTAGQVAPEFAYVILAVVCVFIQHTVFGVNVGMARRKYGVKYPALYATPGPVKGSGSDEDPLTDLTEEQANAFNCIQRVHQNNCEILPVFLTSLLIGGLGFPVPAGILGLIFVAGRYFYARGYYTGDPAKRNQGGWFHIGDLGLIILCIIFAVFLLLGTKPY